MQKSILVPTLVQNENVIAKGIGRKIIQTIMNIIEFGRKIFPRTSNNYI